MLSVIQTVFVLNPCWLFWLYFVCYHVLCFPANVMFAANVFCQNIIYVRLMYIRRKRISISFY